jgi:hypothetical protein
MLLEDMLLKFRELGMEEILEAEISDDLGMEAMELWAAEEWTEDADKGEGLATDDFWEGT